VRTTKLNEYIPKTKRQRGFKTPNIHKKARTLDNLECKK
jgi:hypothetical protein